MGDPIFILFMTEGTYDFDNINISSKEDLNQYISDEEIMLNYFGDFEIGTQYISPFREETSPSFGIFYNSRGDLRWKDWGLFEQAQDAIAYVSKIEGINFYAALTFIYNEIVLSDTTRVSNRELYKICKHKKDSYTKGLKFRKYWKDFEINYWAKLDITPEILMSKFNIYPCDGLWYNGKLWHKSITKDPLFIYLYNRTTECWKMYRPKVKDKTDRFKSNNITNHIQGFDDLPDKGLVVVITSAQKDRIPWFNVGVPSIAPHNEGIILGEAIINDLKSRFKYVVIAMNNDATGLKSNAEYVRRYGLIPWHVPLDYSTATDPSDLWSIFSKDAFIKAAQEIINLNSK